MLLRHYASNYFKIFKQIVDELYLQSLLSSQKYNSSTMLVYLLAKSEEISKIFYPFSLLKKKLCLSIIKVICAFNIMIDTDESF